MFVVGCIMLLDKSLVESAHHIGPVLQYHIFGLRIAAENWERLLWIV